MKIKLRLAATLVLLAVLTTGCGVATEAPGGRMVELGSPDPVDLSIQLARATDVAVVVAPTEVDTMRPS
jgi:hypothetical protein